MNLPEEGKRAVEGLLDRQRRRRIAKWRVQRLPRQWGRWLHRIMRRTWFTELPVFGPLNLTPTWATSKIEKVQTADGLELRLVVPMSWQITAVRLRQPSEQTVSISVDWQRRSFTGQEPSGAATAKRTEFVEPHWCLDPIARVEGSRITILMTRRIATVISPTPAKIAPLAAPRVYHRSEQDVAETVKIARS